MSRRLSPNYITRGISDIARELRMFTTSHQPSASEIWSLSPLRLPDVWTPSQYLINMGFRPTLARRLSSKYMDIVARYRQVFESCFHRAILGSCHLHPEHYFSNIFIIQFRYTIQIFESQFTSAAWVWLCQAGLPTFFGPQCMDVRVDSVTKAEILSRLGLKTTSVIMDATSNRIELPEEERKTDGDLPTKMPPASVSPPLKSTTPSTRDLFHSKKPSTCFPTCYPPPGKPISPIQKTLDTQFELTPPAKSSANCSVDSFDVSSLTALLGEMSVTTSEANLKTQESRKYARASRSKKPEPSPLVSPVSASMSGLSSRPQSPNTDMVPSVKSTTKPRRRKIAALPKRHMKTTVLPTIDSSLSPAINPPISRTPSLISDTSSSADSFSSSDELDTPPSSPPSHSHVLIACNTLPTSAISSKSTGTFRLPMLTRAIFPESRKGNGTHIDFTNGEAVREQQLSFTFGA